MSAGTLPSRLFRVPPIFEDFGDDAEACAVGVETSGKSILVIESFMGGGIGGSDTGSASGIASDLLYQLSVLFAQVHIVLHLGLKKRQRGRASSTAILFSAALPVDHFHSGAELSRVGVAHVRLTIRASLVVGVPGCRDSAGW